MPVIESKGGLSSQGFGEFAKAKGAATYIEDVFSTWLYAGNGYSQTIPNGLALGTAYGGSGYFYPANGSRLYWSFPGTPVQNAVAGTNYTIEFWVYRLPRVNTYQCIFSTENDRNNFIIDASDNLMVKSNGGTTMFTLAANTYIPTYTWTYVALVCSGTTWTLYFNGTAYGTYNGASKTSYATGVAQLGGRNDMDGCGYLSNFRVSTVARYSSNFTPSTIPFTSDASTAMLTLTGSSPFTDISSNAQSMTQAGSIYAQVGYGPFTSATPAKGGMVWLKDRSSAATQNVLYDTSRGVRQTLGSNLSSGQQTDNPGYGLLSFNSTGFTLGPDWSANVNTSPDYFTSWSFAEQPKFFDVVTYTGTGSTRTVAHNLQTKPGFMIIKRSDGTGDWAVYHRSWASGYVFYLNVQNAVSTNSTVFPSDPTSTVFSVGSSGAVNGSGYTYVAYLFPDIGAGGFGASGTQDVVYVSQYAGNGSSSGPVETIGWEPQWVMIKNASNLGDWNIIDNMRGMVVGNSDAILKADTSAAETSVDYISPTATGFQVVSTSSEVNTNGDLYIYIAIRRGPMKTPTSGTSVYLPVATSVAAGTDITTSFPVDIQIAGYKSTTSSINWQIHDRLRGVSSTATEKRASILTTDFAAQATSPADATRNWSNTGYQSPTYLGSLNKAFWNFRRAPNAIDQVVYKGTGVAHAETHNLGTTPEMMIFKSLSSANWFVYHAAFGATGGGYLNFTDPFGALSSAFNNTAPTASNFTVGTSSVTNSSGPNYTAYLFASCPGVVKVGSYSGTGASQTIDCGFTAGARFVLIKRITSGFYGWYVWDSARGMIAGTDPSIRLNDISAEVNANSVYSTGVGFQVVSTAAELNASGITYIFLAIA